MKNIGICDKCKLPMTYENCLIIWNEAPMGFVTELRLVHQIICDDESFMKSHGCCVAGNWPARAASIFKGRRFRKEFDSIRLGALLHAAGGVEDEVV